MAKKKDAVLRIVRVGIRNVLGIEELEFRPQKVTTVTGANGAGKTSVLAAIRAALGGGHDATLLRAGADAGEIVLVLSDGTEIQKKVGVGKSSVKVRHPEMGDVKAPQTFLNDLADAFGANPVTFLTAKAKDRVQTMLEMIPLRVDPEPLAAVTALCSQPHAIQDNAFATLETINADLVGQRREINRQAKEKRNAVEQLERSLPDEEAPADLEADLKTHQAKARAVRDDADRAIEEERRRSDQANESARSDIEAKVQALRKELESSLRNIFAESADRLNRIRSERDEALAAIDGSIADLEAHQKAASARQLADQMQAAAESLEADSKSLSGAIDETAALKAKLCEQLPVDGVEILDGEIYVDGVPFDRVNESRKVRIAIQLAELHAAEKQLPLICVDGLEQLDGEGMATFLEEAKKSTCQFVVTRVSDWPGLEVEVNQ